MLDAALAYARIGWAVMPLEARGKIPLTEHGQKDATTDPAVIRRWWKQWPEANVGISLEPCGLCALDVDPRNGGTTDDLPAWPDTLEAKTGGGGQHIFFRIPQGVTVPGKLSPGLDLKRRGYVVAEPSIHSSGEKYQFLDWDPSQGMPTIADAPAWLIKKLPVNGHGSAHYADEPRDDRLDVARAVREILHAERFHDNLIRLAAHFVAVGMKPPDVSNLLRGLMDAVRNKDERWRDRYAEIPKAVRTAAEKFVPEGSKAEAAARSPLVAISASEFASRVVAPDYVWDGIFQRGYLYALTGHSGSGKTAVALAITCAIALGLSYAGHDTARGRVLYVAGENPDDVRVRLVALCESWGVDVARLTGWLVFVEQSFTLPERHVEMLALADQVEPVAIIFDTDQAVSGTDEENDNSERVAHAKRLREYTKIRSRPAVIDLCHPSAAAQKLTLRPRGASSFLAEIDGNAGVWRDEATGGVEVFRTGKFRGPEFDPMEFQLDEIASRHLADAQGRPMVSIVARPLGLGDLQALDARSAKERIALAVDVSLYPDSSLRDRAGRLGQSKSAVGRGLFELVRKGYAMESPNGHELSPKGKKWIAGQ